MSTPTVESIEALLYPVENDMGEHELQTLILEVLRPLLEALLRQRGIRAHVGSDQYIYWKQNQPQACLAPDIYVLFGVAQSRVIESWKVWETQVAPRFALEVVTSDVKKDYVDNVAAYDDLGTEELVLFDPFSGRNRITFQVFRRDDPDPSGRRRLVRQIATEADRVYAETLDAWIVVTGEGDEARLRVGLEPDGQTLLPTEAERARAEAERARAEQARADAAEARLRALEARLRALGEDPDGAGD